MNQLTLFDYGSLDNETSTFVQEKAEHIHARLKRTAEDIIAIGQDLIEVKARLGHGNFGVWLRAEFGMTDRHALNFMRVASRFGSKSEIISDLPITILYELAAPSTPETIIEMVETGQIPATLPAIREAKQELTYVEPEPIRDFRQTPKLSIPPAQPTIDFSQWQNDNLALGLDSFGDVTEEEIEEEEELFEEVEECSQEAPEPVISLPVVAVLSVPPVRPYTPIVEPVISRGLPSALIASESNEWYTPALYVDAARELMGAIDLDPASNALANQVVQATTYYDIEMNGLEKPWSGHIWLNPPYGMSDGRSNQEIWTQRLLQQFEAGITQEAVLLVNANTEAKWFQPLYDYLICFTNHRIRFYNANGTPNQPTQGNALVYLGSQQRRFFELFRAFGRVEHSYE